MTAALTHSQLAAIKHTKGHLQLIACAGAGKTEVRSAAKAIRGNRFTARPREKIRDECDQGGICSACSGRKAPR